jgi:hypothetical protein
MGLKVVISGVSFTDPTLPILLPDPIISVGSLLLIDFGRASTYDPGAVPEHDSFLGNIAWEQAAALIGSGSELTLRPQFKNTFVGAPTMGTVERTLKKGVHVITSQTAMDSNFRRAEVLMPALIRNYLYTNTPGRTFYFSMWGRLTRLATQWTDAMGYYGWVSTPTHHYVAQLYRGGFWYPDTGSNLVGRRTVPAVEATGNLYATGAFSGWTGTKPPAASDTEFVFWYGARSTFEANQRNKAASGVWYRIYVEDLTASGRTYAAVDALDKVLYDEAFGAGGRFAGDSFTSPATIP